MRDFFLGLSSNFNVFDFVYSAISKPFHQWCGCYFFFDFKISKSKVEN